MEEIKKGDTVKPKSGGPVMTVSDVDDYSSSMSNPIKDGVKCVWFEGKKPISKVFDRSVLEKVENTLPPPGTRPKPRF
jgi:uncharacterized protein YodC (DUF2158 family)